MPNVDSFSLPREWVPEESWALIEAVRGWADREAIPVRTPLS